METHAAQDVKMVLMHAGQYPLADGGECAFVAGQKDCLNEIGYMNPTATNTGGWNTCERRGWCNSDYKNAMPPVLLPIFKQMKTTAANGAGNAAVTSNDYFALFAEKEIFGANTYAGATAEATLFQIEWYKTSANRIKKVNGYVGTYWNCSPVSSNSSGFCCVYSNGTTTANMADFTYGLAPFGCIGKKVTA